MSVWEGGGIGTWSRVSGDTGTTNMPSARVAAHAALIARNENPGPYGPGYAYPGRFAAFSG